MYSYRYKFRCRKYSAMTMRSTAGIWRMWGTAGGQSQHTSVEPSRSRYFHLQLTPPALAWNAYSEHPRSCKQLNLLAYGVWRELVVERANDAEYSCQSTERSATRCSAHSGKGVEGVHFQSLRGRYAPKEDRARDLVTINKSSESVLGFFCLHSSTCCIFFLLPSDASLSLVPSYIHLYIDPSNVFQHLPTWQQIKWLVSPWTQTKRSKFT
jgi:hypothetical protein